MRHAHARRVVEAFEAALGATARIERARGNTWRVATEVNGVPLVFEDVDEACDFLVARVWA